MNRLSKSFGKGTSIRPVLKDVSLSFYPGAKIGVLGSNGSGKSTLMKVRSLSDLWSYHYHTRSYKTSDQSCQNFLRNSEHFLVIF